MAESDAPLEITMREVIATAVRVGRARVGLDKQGLAARMQALGSPWKRQTVGVVEAGERRVSAEELLPLSLALECSMSDLIAPSDPVHRGHVVLVGVGRSVPADDVALSAGSGSPTAFLRWEGARPVWPPRGLVAQVAQHNDPRIPAARRVAREIPSGPRLAGRGVTSAEDVAEQIDQLLRGIRTNFAAVDPSVVDAVEWADENLREQRRKAILEVFGEDTP